MLNAELGKRKGFDHRFGGNFGPSVERKTQGSRETSLARETRVTLRGSWDRWRRTGYKASEADLRQDWQADRRIRGLHDRFRSFGLEEKATGPFERRNR
jgi:hypothetical protein